jgi:CheY-like chemotaxis protein
MNILLIEDDPNKIRQVAGYLESELDVDIQIKRSYASGLKEIRLGQCDLVILDMSLPNYDGLDNEAGRFRSYAGRDILHQMHRRKIRIPVIVMTQYEAFASGGEVVTLADLSRELEGHFSDSGYLGIVYYDAAQDDWKERLSALIAQSAGSADR